MTNLSIIHAKKVTIMPKDMQLARCIRGEGPILVLASSGIDHDYPLIRKGEGKSIKLKMSERLEAPITPPPDHQDRMMKPHYWEHLYHPQVRLLQSGCHLEMSLQLTQAITRATPCLQKGNT